MTIGKILVGAIKWTLLIAIGLIILWHFYIVICLLIWKWNPPSNTAFMNQQAAVLKANNPEATITYQWVDYDQISVNLKSAVIASEDAKFTDHGGFDWDSLEQAIKKNRANPNSQKLIGGSTISQQLAKNLFLSPSRSYVRKGQEAVITFLIEKMWTKKRILEVYLNVAEWGVGVFGAEAASQHYYHKPASKLTRRQAAQLASMLPKPRYYDMHRNDQGLARKTNIILRRMRAAKLPTKDEAE